MCNICILYPWISIQSLWFSFKLKINFSWKNGGEGHLPSWSPWSHAGWVGLSSRAVGRFYIEGNQRFPIRTDLQSRLHRIQSKFESLIVLVGHPTLKCEFRRSVERILCLKEKRIWRFKRGVSLCSLINESFCTLYGAIGMGYLPVPWSPNFL